MGNEADTASQHAVRSWIEQRIKSGKFKKCGHLTIFPKTFFRIGHSPTTKFLPDCNCTSFAWNGPHSTRDDEVYILANKLSTEPIACPKNCHYYEHSYVTSAKKVTGKALSRVTVGFKWFSGLPWQTQLALILLFVVALAPGWVPPIKELIRALRGQ